MSSIANQEFVIKVGPRGDLTGRNVEWNESSYGRGRTSQASVGVTVATTTESSIANQEFVVKVGPRGDLTGQNVEWNESGYGSVRQILIAHGEAINSLQVLYDLNGTLALAHRHGGDGDYFDSFSLEPWENITSVSGRYNRIDNRGAIIIRCLTFATNRTSYGPFGREEGTRFCFNLQPKLEFGGFHGRSNGGYLCAIGLYAKCSDLKHHFEPPPPKQFTAPTGLCSAAQDSPPNNGCMPCSISNICTH